MFYDDEELPAILTFNEVKDYLYVGRNTLLNLLHNGILKGFRAGNQWRIKKEELIKFTQRAEW